MENLEVEYDEDAVGAPSDYFEYFGPDHEDERHATPVDAAVVKCLNKGRSIRRIDLGGLELTARNSNRIAKALRGNPSVKILRFRNFNGWSCRRENGAMTKLCAGLCVHTLEKLSCVEMDLDIVDARAIAQFVRASTAFRKLNLGGNSLGDGGATVIANAIAESAAPIVTVKLDGNEIGARGAASISSMMSKNKSILKLDISSNKLGDAGAIALADGLGENKTLQELLIGGCSKKFGYRAGTALGDLFRKNGGLKQVNLTGVFDNMGPAGVKEVVDGLAWNTGVLEVCRGVDTLMELFTGRAAPMGMARLDRYLATNRGLTSWHAENVPFGFWPHLLGFVSDRPPVLFFMLHLIPSDSGKKASKDVKRRGNGQHKEEKRASQFLAGSKKGHKMTRMGGKP